MFCNIGLNINGALCFDKFNVVEQFNLFYTTVASNLVEKLPKCISRYRKQFVMSFYAVKGVLSNSYSFSIVTENTVLKHLNKLGINKATGLDGIPSRFVRDSASLIACPLTHVVNLSIIQGVVPDKTDAGNYRPVSILINISKVFERIIHDQCSNLPQ